VDRVAILYVDVQSKFVVKKIEIFISFQHQYYTKTRFYMQYRDVIDWFKNVSTFLERIFAIELTIFGAFFSSAFSAKSLRWSSDSRPITLTDALNIQYKL